MSEFKVPAMSISETDDENGFIISGARVGFYSPTGSPKFKDKASATVILDPEQDGGQEVIDTLNDYVADLAMREFKVKKLPAGRHPVKDGDELANKYPAFEGKMYLRASVNRDDDGEFPYVILRREGDEAEEINHKHKDAPYAGCYATVVLRLHAQPAGTNDATGNSWGNQVNAYLQAILKDADGERLAGSGQRNASEIAKQMGLKMAKVNKAKKAAAAMRNAKGAKPSENGDDDDDAI